MILKNNKEVGFIYKNNQNIDKVLNNGNLIFEQGFTREDSGVPPLTTSHLTTGKNLKGYKVYGNSIQDGTPTSSTPIEIESVGDKSKNILDKSQALVQEIREETQFSAWATLTFSNAWVTANLKPDTTYTISYDVECINVPDYDTRYSSMVGFYLYSGVSGYSNIDMYITQYITSGEKLRIEKTITTPSELLDTSANYRILAYTNRYLKNSVGVMSAMIFKNIQIEEGSNASEYEPYGKYKIPIISKAGKNLIWLKDATNVSATNQIYNCSNQTFTKEITNPVGLTNIISNAAFPSIIYSEQLQSGKTYIWKFNNATLLSTGHYLVLTYEDETTQNWYENTPITLTKNATITAIRQAYRNYAKGDIESFQIQVEEGSIATDYEPYKAPIITNIYLNEPLRKVGDYADYIDFESGKIVRNIGKYTFVGTESWHVTTDATSGDVRAYTTKLRNVVDWEKPVLCNIYTYQGLSIAYPDIDKFSLNSNSAFLIGIDGTQFETSQDYKDWVASNNYDAYFVLLTQTEESITLPTIPSIKGTTIYSVGTNIQPSNMYIKYKGR